LRVVGWRVKMEKLELDEILSKYVDILNDPGAESPEERAYLQKYANDAEVLAVLRGARAVKALFESFGNFPTPAKSVRRKGRHRRKST